MKVTICLLYDPLGWTAVINGRRNGPYSYFPHAEEVAKRMAHQAEKNGFPAEILVQTQFGELQSLAAFSSQPHEQQETSSRDAQTWSRIRSRVQQRHKT